MPYPARHPRTRERLLLAILAVAGLIGSLATGAEKNVLMIIADDLNRMISPLDDPNAITPNLERLAARAVCFDNATCQFPFCAPSRTSLFLGLYPWIHGTQEISPQYPSPHVVFPNRVGLPEYFRNHGYWTASYGKTEHTYQPRNWDIQSTDFRFSPWTPDYPRDKLLHSDLFRYAGMAGNTELLVYDLHPNEFIDGISATGALDDLATHRSVPDSAPFFVVVGFDEPHTPWEVPQQIYDQYDPSTIVLNDSRIGAWPAWALKSEQDQNPVIGEERRQDLFRAYLAGVTLMDYQLGRLLDYLDAEKLWEQTVVIFLSDNGYSLCEHERLFSKRNISRENISVPLMIHDPDSGPGNVICSQQVELQDLFPTLIDLCGLPPYPHYRSGRSIQPLLVDPDRPWPHVAKAALATPGRTYATAKIAQLGSLKIAMGGGANHLMLDHATDPSELRAEWYRTESPPTGPQWSPLLDSLDHEFGFERGKGAIFYRIGTVHHAPDRDRDGLPDSEETALVPLGFSPWESDAANWDRLRNGLSIRFEAGPGSGLCIQSPGFKVSRPAGYEHIPTPLDLWESDDLETWSPSVAPYSENPDGSFLWNAPAASPSSPKRYYRLAAPRL